MAEQPQITNEQIEFIQGIARVAHQVNKAYCESIGDTTQLNWEDAPEWQKISVINGVIFHLNNPNANPSDSHDNWFKEKKEQGWVYGPEKDEDAKTHPCMVPYHHLPQEQKSKDYIFRGVVKSFLVQ